MKVGFVAILGRPNAGKSTLLNALLSKKVSIVSHRAQTTRDDISGILNEKDFQIVFVDTPGIYMGPEALDKHMRSAAFGSSRDAEAVVYLIDCGEKDTERDITILKALNVTCPVFLVLNKIDTVKPEQAMAAKELLGKEFPDYQIIEASLIRNFGLKQIKEAVIPTLKEGEPFYPDDMITDKDPAYQAKEVIRQELLHFLKQEIPHQSAVKIDSFEKIDGGFKIEATIALEKENHKPIVIGKGGQMIKKISMSARHELERMWHQHITNLSINVEVFPNWRNDPKLLAEFGYGNE